MRIPLVFVLVLAVAADALAQTTTITSNNLVLHSNGTNSGNTGGHFGTDWTLTGNGYAGTYITLPSTGPVTFTIEASGTPAAGINPNLNLVVADNRVSFNVVPGYQNYSTTMNLPAGTYFVRQEYNNDQPSVDRRLNLAKFTVSGATLSNSSTDANAINAANTYINNYRKGNGTVTLAGVAPGTPVQVDLVKHNFKFGTAVPGNSYNDVLNYLGDNPAVGSTAYKYQQALNANFNAITPENAGKWSNNEGARDVLTMENVDKILDYAAAKHMSARMHNVIWGSSAQQPSWANTLLSQASGGNTTAKNDLRAEISERIDSYVGTGTASDRVRRYSEIDAYNESYHTGSQQSGSYWNVYGASGIADIHNEVAAAAAGYAKVFTNEYNALQDGGDQFANWYVDNIEAIRNAGGQVDGIGVQYYSNNSIGSGNASHSPARITAVLQNLNVQGVPSVLTEFGVKTGASQATAKTILNDSLRLVFGNPDSTGFYVWGFWAGAVWDQAPAGVLYDSNWSLTQAGQDWLDLMSIDGDADPNDDWDTSVNTTVAGDGTINFNGFYGDYVLTINGQQHPLTLSKGTTNYSLNIGGTDGDFDDNGVTNAADIDILWHIVRGTGVDPNTNDSADLNDDGFVNELDVDTMLAEKLTAGTGRQYGDADLDGGVGGLDYAAWRQRAGSGWANGDFDGDDGVGGLDYTLWRTRPTAYPTTVGPHAGGGSLSIVPEPGSLVLLGVGGGVLLLRRGRNCVRMRRL